MKVKDNHKNPGVFKHGRSLETHLELWGKKADLGI